MAKGEHDIVIVGGGAAGIAAARRLHEAGADCLLVEARPRLGGRAYTVTLAGHPIDLGCGWLHSADRNPWAKIAQAQGRTLDKTLPPWARPSYGFSPDERDEFRQALRDFHERIGEIAQGDDVPASQALPPGGRWNALIGAITTFISGGEPEQVSAKDFDNYEDTEVNWRVTEGYGATVATYGGGLPVALDSPVTRIDHSGKSIKIDTAKGTVAARRVIVTLPTSILSSQETLFIPALPDKVAAARGLPLGLADKLFIALDHADDFEADTSLFGAKGSSATAAYHMRPFGRSQIEVYFGGTLAWELEGQSEEAFFDFASGQLRAQFGSDFGKRIKPIHMHRWGADPFSRGAYSYARPGQAEARLRLAAPVDGRLFFAGEACSAGDYSTAHGAYRTGVAAAEQALASLRRVRA